MVFSAVKDAGTDLKNGSSHKNDLNDVSSGNFNSQKVHDDHDQVSL